MQRFPDASFAENFYGLKRRRRPYIEADRAMAAVGGVPQRELLSNKDIWRSLAFLVRLRPHTFDLCLTKPQRLEFRILEQRHRTTSRH